VVYFNAPSHKLRTGNGKTGIPVRAAGHRNVGRLLRDYTAQYLRSYPTTLLTYLAILYKSGLHKSVTFY
jgi:hypothetical protein